MIGSFKLTQKDIKLHNPLIHFFLEKLVTLRELFYLVHSNALSIQV